MDKMLVKLLFLCCLAMNFAECNVNAINPGLKIRITQKGLEYAAQQAINVLSKDVTGQVLPVQEGKYHAPGVGSIKYKIKNTRIVSFNTPKTTITTSPFRWYIGNIGAKIHGDWHWEKKIHKIHVKVLSDHGSFDVSLSGWALDNTMSMGVDATGRPTIKSVSCICGAGHVSVKFHGGASWLYNLFKGSIADALKKQLKSQLCKSVVNTINSKAAKELATLKVTVPLGKKLYMDYRLTAPPLFTSKNIESSHKGEVFWTGDKQEAPFSAPPLQDVPSDKMITVWLSDYILGTLAYVVFKHGALSYFLTQKDIAQDKKGYLNTTCSTGRSCVGTDIPQIATKFPGANVALNMSVSQTPSVNGTDMSGGFTGDINFNVVYPNKPSIFAFSTKLSMEFGLKAGVKGISATLDIGKYNIGKIVVTKSAIGSLKEKALSTVMQFAIDNFIKPKLQELGSKGIELPTLKGIQFVSPEIKIIKHGLVLLTDVKYVG